MAAEQSGAPANTGGIDQNALAQAIGSVLGAQLATVLKPINDAVVAQGAALAKLTTPKTEEPAATAPKGDAATAKPITLEDVQRVMKETMNAQLQQQQQSQQRDAFLTANLGKLPKMYQAALGTDPAKWADEAKAIQSQYESDFKATGAELPTIGGASQDGGKPASQQPQDLSKRDGYELLNEAVAEQTPQRPPAPATK